jgi:hypothetical protein
MQQQKHQLQVFSTCPQITAGYCILHISCIKAAPEGKNESCLCAMSTKHRLAGWWIYQTCAYTREWMIFKDVGTGLVH